MHDSLFVEYDSLLLIIISFIFNFIYLYIFSQENEFHYCVCSLEEENESTLLHVIRSYTLFSGKPPTDRKMLSAA